MTISEQEATERVWRRIEGESIPLLVVGCSVPDYRTLSPNARSHWAKRMQAAKANRNEAALVTTAARRARYCMAAFPDYPRYELSVTWYLGPKRRRLDDDNAKAALKSIRDGIADALGVNDRRMVWARDIEWRRGNPAVKIVIRGIEAGAGR